MFSNMNFNEKNKCNYALYVDLPGKNTKENLYRKISEDLKNIENKKVENILDDINFEIENGTYLDKQTTTSNSVIPYQVNQMELIKILDNQSKYYPYLKDIEEKIVKIHEFKIPYYVGPLGNKKYSEFAWAERKKEGKIYPWNFEEMIDRHKSAEAFIERMKNKCTYLTDQDVIPKCSLLYEKFEVLNELNKIKINDKAISDELKQKIFNQVFTKKQTVSKKYLEEWLVREGEYKTITSSQGYQKEKEFSTSRKSYIKFVQIFGEINKSNEAKIEEIIKWLTLFEDRTIVEEKLRITYPEISESDISKLVKLNLRGWGRFSEKLLCGIKNVDSYGNSRNILDYLYETNMNFMQIINKKDLSFKEKIENWGSQKKLEKIAYDDVKEIQGSPSIKKAIWQVVQLAEEIVKVVGSEPSEIILEFARSDEKPKRTTSKVDRLTGIYDEISKNVDSHLNSDDFNYVKNELKKVKEKKDKLDNQKLYLYFIQNGRCMYSGKKLDISSLSNYQVDHIIPQSIIKDDSIENLALVYTIENQRKKDGLTLENDVIDRQQNFWRNLHKVGLIGSKKLYNLNRREFNESELEGFVNRQLVETRQITKYTANLLQQRFANTELKAIKASLNSDFRSKLKLYKSREINDIHHAHDAYLAAVISRFISIRLPGMSSLIRYSSLENYMESNKKENGEIKYRKLFKYNKGKTDFGFVPNLFIDNYAEKDTGEVIWDSTFEIEKIVKFFDDKKYFVTKKLEEGTGQFYNINIVNAEEAKKSKEGLIPIRKNKTSGEYLEPTIYGGYKGVNKAYYLPIEFIQEKATKKRTKREVKREVVGVPIHVASLQRTNDEKLLEYLKKSGYNEARIIGKRILKHQLIEVDGARYYLTSESEFNNANQLILNRRHNNIIAQMNKANLPQEERMDIEDNLGGIYEELIVKYESHFNGFASIKNKLIEFKPYFKELSYEDKAKFFKETLKITRSNAENANWKSFRYMTKDKNDGNFKETELGGERVGRKEKVSINLDKTRFIDQSVTGMYEKSRVI